MKDTRNLVLGVTLGDATGIGPELIVKALNDNEIKSWQLGSSLTIKSIEAR